MPRGLRRSIWGNTAPTLKERLLAQIEEINGCWLWNGGLNSTGYGRMFRDGRYVFVHRLSYEVHVGPIEGGLHVLHHCDTPRCVRPEHLFLGTMSDNMLDASAKGRLPCLNSYERQRTQCDSGHVYTLFTMKKDKNGYRICTICLARKRERKREKEREKRRNAKSA